VDGPDQIEVDIVGRDVVDAVVIFECPSDCAESVGTLGWRSPVSWSRQTSR